MDLQQLFYTFALEARCGIFFGLKPNCGDDLGSDDIGFAAFATDFDTVQEYLSVRTKLGWAYFLYDGPRFRQAISRINSFVDQIVQRALSGWDPKEAATFLDQLVAEAQDPKLLRSQLLHLLIAARDTVAVTLGWAFYNLARHPDVYSELRRSVLEILGPYDASTPAPLPSALSQCLMLRHVIFETLRLHPPIPLNTRTALRDTWLPRGGGPTGDEPIHVRRGDEVLYSVYAMHRDPKSWGADANVFRPGRWAGRRHGWDYLPFNGGPRICLGQRLAMHELSCVIARIVQRFEAVESTDTTQEVVARVTLTNSSGTGVLVRLRGDYLSWRRCNQSVGGINAVLRQH